MRDRSDRKGVKDFQVVKVVAGVMGFKGVKWFKVQRLVEFELKTFCNCLYLRVETTFSRSSKA